MCGSVVCDDVGVDGVEVIGVARELEVDEGGDRWSGFNEEVEGRDVLDVGVEVRHVGLEPVDHGRGEVGHVQVHLACVGEEAGWGGGRTGVAGCR